MRWSWLRSKRQEALGSGNPARFPPRVFVFRIRFILVEFRSGGLAYSKREDGWADFAQPTPWRFGVGCRSCPRESSSSNCSCVGLFCAYAARLVLRERLWGEANIRRQPDSNPGTAPPACHRDVFRRALGRPTRLVSFWVWW